jgi:hypothetical protein
VVSNVRVDPNNPYGQYQQLLRSGAKEAITADQDAAGRGLRGGFANAGETQAKYDFGAGSRTLGTNLQNTLSGYDTSQAEANDTRNQAIVSAQEQAAQAALQAQLSEAQTDWSSQLGALQAAVNAATGGSGSGGGAATSVPAYIATPAGQAALQQVINKPASAGSSGSAGVLKGQTKKNYQAAKNSY